ncbi:UPF0183 domain containing protein [Trichuris trichiura]|uniref:UPF0183 domain containing protein n=1 Tax=Trichuris trichiura TaxID=36087 RepID=A0A077YZH4_TRITR|nr:UPF0183 domain containing protein [Trichuris trichiura]
MDVLFDATMNTAKKFILHTNFPGHYDFSIYYRCNFALALGSSSSIVLTAQSKWSEIESFLSCDEEPSLPEEKLESRKLQQPVVLNRCSSNNDSNPFGSTFCFGLQDVIFEVMANDHIATVMLLNS